MNEKKQLPKITEDELQEYISPSYINNLKFESTLIIERKDKYGLHSYTGELHIDRTSTSRLLIKQKSDFELTFADTIATINTKDAKPIELDLTNIAHNIVIYREVSVIEFNPFRYLRRFYDYSIDLTDNDTIMVVVDKIGENKKAGDIKIFIQKETGFITDLFFYSPSGDLARHVEYRKPVRIEEEILPSEIFIYFPVQATVVREHYRLINIKLLQ